MQQWHKLRNGAYFVDFILLIAAIMAMVGLATFVHLHTSKAPDITYKQNTTAINSTHMGTLSPETGTAAPTQPGPSSSSAPGASDSAAPIQLQSTMSAPEVKSKPVNCITYCIYTGIDTETEIVEYGSPANVLPIKVPRKPCNGLLKNSIRDTIQSSPDSIECPLN